MAALEPVVATLLANTEEFKASLDAAKADMDSFAAESVAAGDAASAGLSGGIKTGAEDAANDLSGLGVAGKKAGEDVKTGLGDASGAYQDAAGKWRDANGRFISSSDQVSLGLKGVGDDLEKTGGEASKSGGLFSDLSNIFGGLPGPLGEAQKKTGEFSDKLDKAGNSSSGLLSAVGSIPSPMLIAGAAIAGVAAVSIDMASKYQTATNQIAASEGITTGAATKIGAAFLGTAGNVTFSAQQIATSFATVAGQAKQINGSALTASQSMTLMQSSMDAAEASGSDLASTTGAITTALQAFGLGIKSSPLVANALYVAANATGQSITAVGNALDKVKTKLGGMAPPLTQMSGLLLDLTSHGETGRAAMSALTTTFTAFLKPATDAATAQNNLKAAVSLLPPSLQALAQQYQAGTLSGKDLTNATQMLSSAQLALWSKFTAAAGAAQTAGESQAQMGITAVTATGQLAPMSSIIGQLQDKIKGMGTAQATAELSAIGLKNASAKLVETIQAGPAAYEKYVAEVSKHNAAADAAAKATAGMHAQFEKAKSGIEDAGVALGQKLLPAVTAAATGIAKFIADVVKDWPEISKVFEIAFDIIKPIIMGMIDTIKGIALVIEGIVDFVKGVFTGNWGEAWKGVREIFRGVWDDVKGILNSTMGVLAGILHAGWDKISGDLHSAWSSIINFFTSIPGRIVSALDALGGLLLGWITNVWDTFTGWIHAAWEAELAYWSNVPGKIISALAAFGGLLLNWITQAWNTFKSWIETAWNNEVAFWQGLPSKIINALASFGGMFAHWMEDAWTSFSTAVSTGWTAVSSWFSGLPGKIISAIGSGLSVLYQWGSDLVTGIINGIESAASAVGGAIVKIITGGINSAKNVLNNIPVVGGLFSAVGLATGGYVTQPTLALVGEAGPEFVIPEALLKSQYSAGIQALPSIEPIPVSAGFGGSGGGISAQIVNQPINLVVNGQTLAQIVTQFQLRGARATGNIAGQYAGGNQTGAATGVNVNAVTR